LHDHPGAAYYAILSDMYEENLGFVIGIQEAVTGLGYMIGPLMGAGLYSWGGFRLPFMTLGACPFVICLLLPALLRDARNFEHEYDPNPQLPSCEPSPTSSVYSSPRMVTAKLLSPPRAAQAPAPGPAAAPAWRRVLTLPFVYVALGTTLATCGFAFVEPVLSEHLMAALGVSTSVAGVLMGVPSVTYIVSAPIGGWLGEKVGYRPVMFGGFVGFALALFLIGPAPVIPAGVAHALRWPIQVLALALLGMGSAFGTITTLPDMQRSAGPGTTDITASLFNNVFVPSGEVLGPLRGGGLTQLLGLPRAAVCLGWGLAAYAAVLLALHVTGHMSWRHHREGGGSLSRAGSQRSLREGAGVALPEAKGEDTEIGSPVSVNNVYVSFKDDMDTVYAAKPSRLQ
jgi:MFS family permease